MNPFLSTHQTVYRETPLKVTVRTSDGSVLSVALVGGGGITDLLTDEQKIELAEMVRKEREDE